MNFYHGIAGFLTAMLLFSCAPNGNPVLPSSTHAEAAAGSPALLKTSKPSQRPGLATGWGRRKTSPVRPRDFVRASSTPAGTDVIFYNDSQGIHAMASNKQRVGAMQSAAGGLVEWGIRGRHGFLNTYKEFGYGRRLVAGSKGAEYSIFVKNRSRSTLEIVASVDGLDVMDGAAARYAKRGYLVEPGDTLTIGGFRSGWNSEAAFKFSGVGDSYANLRHGNTRNIGVIGIAVFTQRGVDPWKWSSQEIHLRNTANPFASPPPGQN